MPNFTYSINIPFASHNPSSDQPIMQTNTNSISSIIGVDHYGFNNNLGGYHKQVSLVNETNPGTPSGVGSVLFGKNNEWWFQNASLGLNAIQMTNSAFFPLTTLLNGRTFLPGGLVLQWGFVNGTHGADLHFNNQDSGTVLYASPFTTATLNVLVSPGYTFSSPPTSASGITIGINGSTSNAGFSWTANTASGSYTFFFWAALGY